MSRSGTDHSFHQREIGSIRVDLLHWYRENRRNLPWRDAAATEDRQQHAYAVWVSEIMLQQTRVATVIDYYKRWMARWPSLKDLSEAELEHVNEVWAGLGYYSRGRRLLEGTKKIMQELCGKIPETAEMLVKEIPGVGRYTAAAIASIAFDEPVGVVDGNVIRVITRLLTIGGDSSAKNVLDFLWKQVNRLVPENAPGDFNQALMELGALVCTPTSPACESCPLRTVCRAFREMEEYRSKNSIATIQNSIKERRKRKSSEKLETSPKKHKLDHVCAPENTDIEDCADFLGLPKDQPWDPELGVTNYPRKAKKKPPRQDTAVICVVEWRGHGPNREVNNEAGSVEAVTKFLLTQRPNTGLLAGLWEFPTLLLSDKETSKPPLKNYFSNKGVQPCNSSSKYIAKLTDNLLKTHLAGLKVQQREHVGEYAHVFSHIRLRYIIEHVTVTGCPDVIGACKVEIKNEHGAENDAAERNSKWVNKDCLGDNAVSSAMIKIAKLCDHRVKNGKKDKQAKLTQFFIQK